MDQYTVEAILRQQPRSLSLFPTTLERAHVLEERACKNCWNVLTWVRKRCKDRLCKYCAGRGYGPLCRRFQSLPIVPSHLIHLVLPYPPIPLHQLKQDHVTALHLALGKFRRRTWFKCIIKGGFYFFELDINERWKARLHVHLLIETYKPTQTRPIVIRKASAEWYQLTGQYMEAPRSLKKYTSEESNNSPFAVQKVQKLNFRGA